MRNIFDVNGDGHLDSSEQFLEFEFFQQVMNNAKNTADDVEESDDGITLDFSLGVSDEDAEDDWRNQYYGNDMEIDPDDYDSEEEYQDAYKEKESWIEGISERVTALADEYGIDPVDYDDYDEFIEALKDEIG